MKRLLSLSTLLLLGAACGAQALTYRVERSYPLGAPKVGGKTVIQFSLYRSSDPAPLTAADLDLEHEKLIHLMAIDSGFVEYMHEHPEEVSPGVWQLPVFIKTPGDYRFFLQFHPSDELTNKLVFFDDRYAESPSQVVPTAPVHSGEQLAFVDGEFKVTMSFTAGPPTQKKITPVRFTIEKNGVVIPMKDLDNYLGVKAHIAAIAADKNDFVHAHPGERGAQGEIGADPDAELVKLYCKEAGYYGVFMQFQYKGVLHTTQFAIHVKPALH